MASLSLPAPAKLNLTLRVLGRRPDGFHELDSLVALTSFADTITVCPRDDGEIALECRSPGIPSGPDNLALRAAELLAEEAGLQGPPGVTISIEKRIPPGAGLGGGSSNAATTLILLNILWKLGLTKEGLARIGARIGSDVPLFFFGPLCRIQGRGERVETVPRSFVARVLLLFPGIHCDTKAIYAAWDALWNPGPGMGGEPVGDEGEKDSINGLRPGDLHRFTEEPGTTASVPGTGVRAYPAWEDILAGLGDPDRLNLILYNDLEKAALEAVPGLADWAERVRRALPVPVHMTGSGSAFFVITRNDPAHAADLKRMFLAAGVPGHCEIVEIYRTLYHRP